MKTFKQHVNEHSYMGGQVGAATSNSVKMDQLALTIYKTLLFPLQKVNAFVGSIAEREYLQPQFAIDELKEKKN